MAFWCILETVSRKPAVGGLCHGWTAQTSALCIFLLSWMGLAVCCTSPCSAGAVWIGLLLCSSAQTFGHCKHPEGKLFFWKLLSILSVPGVSKIQSGNIPVMWNMRLTMRGWAELTFQVCCNFFVARTKERVKERRRWWKNAANRTHRDKNTFDNSKGWYTGKPKHSLLCMWVELTAVHAASTRTWHVN